MCGCTRQSGASSVTLVQSETLLQMLSLLLLTGRITLHTVLYVGMETYYSLPYSTAPDKHMRRHTTTNIQAHSHIRNLFIKKVKMFYFSDLNL